jgi:hypothetical protein
VLVLQVVYLHGTDQRTQLSDKRSKFDRLRQRPRGLHRDVIQANATVGVRRKATETIAESLKTLPGIPSFAVWDTQSSASGIRSGMREKFCSMKSSYAARIKGSGVSGGGQSCSPDDARDERRFRGCAQRLPILFLQRVDERSKQDRGTEAWSHVLSVNEQ